MRTIVLTFDLSEKLCFAGKDGAVETEMGDAALPVQLVIKAA